MSRRATITRAKVLEAALRLVDGQGLKALSMRRLGQELGVEAMSLYRHVSSKADVLDGIHGAILAEMELPPLRGSWSTRLGSLAHAFRRVLCAHPNALPVFASRPAMLPSLKHVEAVLGVLESAGFDRLSQLQALHTVVAYVVGSAFLQLGLVEDQESRLALGDLSGADLPHLAAAAPLLEGYDEEAEFTFGLDLLVRGLEARARRRRRRGR